MKQILSCQMIVIILIGTIAACSGVPKEIRQAAVDVPFETLLRHTDRYLGQTVILGGYIEHIQTAEKITRIVVLQAPLGMLDQPTSKEASEGRFLVIHAGTLDPEYYGIGQDITVAGRVLGRRVSETGDDSDPMPVIEAREIYRWHYGHDEEVEDVLEAAEPP